VATPPTLVAVKVTGKVCGATEVVPVKVAVPLPRSANVIPAGNAPASVSAGVGEPLEATVKENAWPATAVAEVALVICGGRDTVSVTESTR